MILKEDYEEFQERFRSAAAFIVEAELRYECHNLAVQNEITPWQTIRLEQLLQSPACREEWFVALLRRDGAGMEEFLAKAKL
jgi:hypothetical protein